MYDKLSVIIDILTEDADVISAEENAVRAKADGKPFASEIDHTTRSKIELVTRAQNLQQSLKLVIFQVEQGTVLRVIVTRMGGGSKASSYEWFNDIL